MAQDDEPLAFIAAPLRLTLSGQAHLDDEVAHLLLRLIEAVDRLDAPGPLPAQEGDAARVLALRRIERVEDDEPRPGLPDIEVVGVRDEGRDLRARRPR